MHGSLHAIDYIHALSISFKAILKLGLVALIGFIPVRMRIVTEGAVHAFTRLAVDIFVPVTIIFSLLRAFSPAALTQGSAMILAVVGWIVGGAALAALVFRMVPGGDRETDRASVPLCSMQNSFYFPIPMAMGMLPEALHSKAVLYTSLGLFATSPLQWTLGTFLLRRGKRDASGVIRSVISAFSMPVIGVIIGVTLSFVPGLGDTARQGSSAPGAAGVVFGAMEIISRAMTSFAMILVGGLVALTRVKGNVSPRTICIVAIMKLIVIPAGVFILIRTVFSGFEPMVRLMILLQASSPSAINLALAARRFGGNWAVVSATQLPVYAFSMLTVPLWLSLELGHVL